MKLMLVFLFALLLIGGGMKLITGQLPGIDYPFFSGPMAQPHYERVTPDLNLP